MAKTQKKTEETSNENTLVNPKEKGSKRTSVSNTAKAGLKVHVPRVNKRIVQSRVTERVGASTAVQMAAALEYTLKEIISLATDNVISAGKYKRIKPRDIVLTVRSDQDFSRLLAGHRILTGDKIKSSADELLTESDKKYNKYLAEKKESEAHAVAA